MSSAQQDDVEYRGDSLDQGPNGISGLETLSNALADSEDIESTKSKLRALVAAGAQAHDILGLGRLQEDDDEDEDDDEEDEMSDESEHEGDDNQLGNGIHGSSILAEHEVLGDDNGGNDYYYDPVGGSTEESRQELVSRVTSGLQALMSHGLTTASYNVDQGLDDDEAYSAACQALEHNLRYQRLLRAQLASIDAAQRRNHEQQESIGALLSMQARATNRRGNRRHKDDKAAQVDPVTGDIKFVANTYFADIAGEQPPDNRDTIRKKKHPPIIYRARRWTDAERDALVKGVRQCNRKLLAQRLYQQTGDPRSVWDVDKFDDKELELNLTGLDWKFISKQFVPTHKPVECAIQWATQDHPIINKEPWSKKEEKDLRRIVEEKQGHDWVAIAQELDTQRTASQCFQVYQRKLNPGMSRSKWTEEEDRILTEAVMAYGEGDWQSVAACLDNRTGQQVLHRWCKSINPAIKSGRWDRDEDAALQAAVRLYGVGQWTKIAKHVPGRTDVKCRERYMNVLAPEVNNKQWTPDEDDRLIAIVNRVGIGKWSYVADVLGGRTDNQCWRHWRSLHKKGRAPDPPENLDELSGEEGTVPSFPEWEAERRRRRQNGEESVPGLEDEGLLSFARTQGTGRKRKTTAGIESARKRQWKRATSTNFTPLLATPALAQTDEVLMHETTSSRAESRPPTVGPMEAPAGLELAPTVGRQGRRESSAAPGGRKSSMAPRRGRVLNWGSILQQGAETRDSGDYVAEEHLKPVLPCVGTVQGLQRLVEAVPEVASAFNAELVGLDDPELPDLEVRPMNWLRQRIEALFIWPMMLGTFDPSVNSDNKR